MREYAPGKIRAVVLWPVSERKLSLSTRLQFHRGRIANWQSECMGVAEAQRQRRDLGHESASVLQRQ